MPRFHALKVAEVRRETPDSVSIALQVPDALREEFVFQPGQYLTLRATIDGEEARRPYSLCSSPDEPLISIGVRKQPGGAFSTFANERLKAGDTVEAMPPEGRFVLKPGAPGRHVLAIAAGSGITPILSIAKALLANDARARFTLIYGNRTSQSTMFAEPLEDLKDRHLGRVTIVYLLSREALEVELRHGRIDAARLAALADGVVDVRAVDEAFLCGPEGMIAEASRALAGLGLPGERIHVERFTPAEPRKRFVPPPAGAAETVVARVSVKLDGKRNAFDMLASDPNIVDAAARAGLDLPHSCKGGMCCTCRCRVVEGAVEMAANYSLEPWELEQGFRLACQSTPTTPTLTLDFDQT